MSWNQNNQRGLRSSILEVVERGVAAFVIEQRRRGVAENRPELEEWTTIFRETVPRAAPIPRQISWEQ